MFGSLDKQTVVDAFHASLDAAIADARARAKATAASATHAESKAENDKDTRAIEESYLAAGQAQRAADLELELAQLKALPSAPVDDDTPLRAGALVLIEDEDETQRALLITTASGGRSVTVDGWTVRAVTPHAPLGRALLRRTVGDEISLRIKGKQTDYTIVDVR